MFLELVRHKADELASFVASIEATQVHYSMGQVMKAIHYRNH